jgi:tripartite-type tricarboxylate transporter receptor subunit TctC
MKRSLTCGLLMLAAAIPALAQDFPTRTITVVVPYAAGGAMDAVGRVISDALASSLKATTVVDNRVGGNGIVGMTHVSRAEPDGHTLMISSETGQAILPAIDPAFPIDSLNTFTPISQIGSFPHFLVVRKSLGVNSVAELIAHAKANPGKLNMGNNGAGTIAHISIELLKKKANIDIVNVPYRGASAALTDLIAGTVDANIQSLPVMAGHLDNPALKIVAILSGERDKRFPDVPTMVESGIPDFVFVSWTALFGPPKMPPSVVAKLSTAVSTATKTDEVAQRLRKVGFEPIGSDAPTLDKFQREVAANWKKIAAETGIKVQ